MTFMFVSDRGESKWQTHHLNYLSVLFISIKRIHTVPQTLCHPSTLKISCHSKLTPWPL